MCIDKTRRRHVKTKYIFNVTSLGPNSHSAYHVVLNINGVDTENGNRHWCIYLNCEQDVFFYKITVADPKPSSLRRSQAKLQTYNTGDVIIPEGETTVCVCYENQCKELDLTVVSGLALWAERGCRRSNLSGTT